MSILFYFRSPLNFRRMKHILLAVFSLLATSTLFAQSVPQKMNYQAVARLSDGKVISEQTVILRIGIMSAEDMERPVYSEEHRSTTNEFGLFNLQIGTGSVIEGSMESIDWGSSAHYLRIHMDAENTGFFEEMGTSQLLTVPYAFYAERSGTSDDGNSRNDPDYWALRGNASTNSGVNFVGTTDAQDLVFKTNGTEAARFDTLGNLRLNGDRALKIGDFNALNMRGVRNIHIGEYAGGLSTGKENAFIGYRAGYSNTSGVKNTFIGSTTGRLNTIGNQNVFVGGRAGFVNTEGSRNSFLGYQSGRLNTNGEENTFVGRYAGVSNVSGSFNTYVGSGADGTTGLTNATALGAGAVVTQSNSVVLGNNANVGIGTSSPAAKLTITNGDVYINDITKGVIMKSLDGSCWRMTVSNAGGIVVTSITCP
ncbi:MAG: hypothetical protein ACI8VL_001259 [Bacteroidia bacterium]|jgi:hypothetical protein